MAEPIRDPSASELATLREENARLVARVEALELERAQSLALGSDVSERAAHTLQERERQLILSRALLAEAQSIAHIGSWEVDQRDFTTHWSDEIYRILGLDPRTVPPSYATFLEMVHPEDRARVDEACRDAVARGVDYEITHRMCLRDGTVKYVHQSYAAAFDGEGKQIRAFGTVQDVTEQRLREEELRRAHDRMEATLQALPDLMFELDDRGIFLSYHAQDPSHLLVKPEAFLGTCFRDVLPRSVLLAVEQCLSQARERGVSDRIYYALETPAVAWYEMSAAAKRGPGEERGFVVLARDITPRMRTELELKRSLEEQRVLLREIHHRVKNNLQIISSLLYFQARSAASDEARLQFEDCRSRVKAMGMVHEALLSHDDVRNIDFAAYLSKITSALRESYSPAAAGVVFRVEAAPIGLDIQQAVPCGLIVNELITNALKYAFVGRTRGAIRIELVEEGERLRLTVADDGVGCPLGVDPLTSETLGLRLVRTLAQQVDAELSFDLADGVCTTLRLKRYSEARLP